MPPAVSSLASKLSTLSPERLFQDVVVDRATDAMSLDAGPAFRFLDVLPSPSRDRLVYAAALECRASVSHLDAPPAVPLHRSSAFGLVVPSLHRCDQSTSAVVSKAKGCRPTRPIPVCDMMTVFSIGLPSARMIPQTFVL